ncbi:MAG TPA: glycoside hydrolase family 9 protein [Bacillota bacterium]|nr:glycoside hydrolase family 9 protein [Bacillota bacterium]
MKKSFLFLFIFILTICTLLPPTSFAAAFTKADYQDVYQKSILFFDGNRCGPDVATDNVFSWRGACHTTDSYNGIDLTGGFHDAGDHVKFSMPAAFSASYMGWMLYEYPEVFNNYGITNKTLATLKQFTDYFLKCHPSANTYIYEVGDGSSDHGYWGPPETQTTARPVLLTTGSKPASDVLGNTAGALALMYLNYKNIDATYANRCLQAAKELYAMGTANKGLYDGGKPGLYESTTFYDDLAWAALWLYIAGGQTETRYLTEIDDYLSYPKPKDESHWQHIWTICWGDMYLGVHFKMAQMGNAKALDAAKWSMNYWMTTVKKTPGGLAWLDGWGPTRYSLGEMGLFLFYYNKIDKDPTVLAFAEKQVDYIMGSNPRGLSYVIGFGAKQVQQPHHRAANGWTYADPGGITQPAKHQLTGALIGGPDASDAFNDQTTNYQQTEVALDYNACLVAAMTGYMKAKFAIGNPPTIQITAPVNGTHFVELSDILITANASDSDGTVSKVEFYNENTLLPNGTITTPPYRYTWQRVLEGNYTITAIATDNSGNTTTATVNIIVENNGNIPPTVSITSPANGQAFHTPANITIQTNAADSDGTVAKVDFYNGTTLLGTDTAAPFTYTITNAALGSYSITAVATDNGGKYTTSTAVTFTVTPPNGTGTGLKGEYFDNMDFTNLKLTQTDATVDFNWAGGTPDPSIGADTFSVRWSGQVEPKYSETYTFYASHDDGVRVYVNNHLVINNWTDHAAVEDSGTIALIAGQKYDIRMEYYENGGDASANLSWSCPSQAKQIIPQTQLYSGDGPVPVPPTVSITSPANEATFAAPAAIAIQADAADSDGTVTQVDFYNGTALLGSDTTAPYSFNWNNVPAGTYTITAKATDSQGLTATSSVTVTVNSPDNNPPTISLTSPTNGQSFVAPAIIVIRANAADSDGTVTRVDFYNGTTLLATDTTAPYSYPWMNVVAGNYTITAVATDNQGATATSSVNVVVTPSGNLPPTVTITSPTDGQSFTAPATITIQANAADSDGTVTKVDFYNGSTLLSSDTSAPYSFSWANVPAGTYMITAVVTDNGNLSTTSSPITVVVNGTPPALKVQFFNTNLAGV